jgi:hypothetical protein
VTVLLPSSSGITADQFVVPAAIPDDPVLVDHVTFATAVLSDAVPVNVSAAEVVDSVVCPGEATVIEGGVVSPLGVGLGVGVGLGLGDGVGVGVGDGLGAGFGVGAGFGDGLGVGVGVGLGLGDTLVCAGYSV